MGHESLVDSWDNVALVEGGLTAVDVELFLFSLVNRHIVTSVVTHVMLPGSDDFVLRVIQELVPVGQPANSSGNHEEDREHIRRKTESLVNDSTVEINVGIELSFNEVRIAESNSLKFDGDLDQLLLSDNLENFISNFLNNFGSRVVIFIHSVAEAI